MLNIQVEIPELEELEQAIEEHEEIAEQLRQSAAKIRSLQLKIDVKLKENR